jgi:hypothetical protein
VIDFIGKDTNLDCGGWSEIAMSAHPRARHFIRKRPNIIRGFRQTHFNGE